MIARPSPKRARSLPWLALLRTAEVPNGSRGRKQLPFVEIRMKFRRFYMSETGGPDPIVCIARSNQPREC